MRRWARCLGFVLASAVVLLFAVEAMLRLANWGYPASFCLTQSSKDTLSDNDKFLWQFYSRNISLHPNPFRVAKTKPVGAIRIVLLGESAAAGSPDPAYGLARILERMLRQQYPQRQIEVINAAMRGANSHVLRRVAEDARVLHPDLFLIYSGNHEEVGLWAPAPGSGPLMRHLHLLRAVQWIRSTRWGEMFEPLLQKVTQVELAEEKPNDSYFQKQRMAADDSQRRVVAENFRSNLRDICRTARSSSAAVVLTTVASNLIDCPPFASLHRPGLAAADRARWQGEFDQGKRAQAAGENANALEHYAAAAGLDDQFAELHYRSGQCWEASGQRQKALLEFTQARDWDALALRADSRLNRVIAEVGRDEAKQGVLQADTEEAMNHAYLEQPEKSPEPLWHDHIHLTFDGTYRLARAMLPVLQASLHKTLGRESTPAGEILSRSECARQLAVNRVSEAQITSTILRWTARTPFTGQFDHSDRHLSLQRSVRSEFHAIGQADLARSATSFQTAIEAFPDDWYLHYNFARLLLVMRDYLGAADQFHAARRFLPDCLVIRMGLSSALSSAGKFDEALWQLNESLALDPQSRDARAAIMAVEAQRRKATAF